MKTKVFLILRSILLLPSAGFSITIRVPGDHPKIQQAIDALSYPGDVVLDGFSTFNGYAQNCREPCTAAV